MRNLKFLSDSERLQLPDKYQQALKELESVNNRHSKNNNREVCFEKFIKSYLLPSRGWVVINIPETRQKQAIQLSLNDFCYSLNAITLLDIKLITAKPNLSSIRLWKPPPAVKYQFTYPRATIRKDFIEYEKTSDSFSSKNVAQMVDKMEAMHEKISKVYGNLEEWIDRLKEYGEEDFVWQNIEYRISQELCNKDLWSLYFRYLEDHNPEGLPRALSAYCRLWIDDAEMKKKFEAATKKYPDWKKYFPFSEREAIKPGKKRRSEVTIKRYAKKARKCGELVASQSIASQRLSLPKTMVNYTFKNVSFNLLSKLQKSSKSFFFKASIPLCHRFSLVQTDQEYQGITYQHDSLNIVTEEIILTDIPKLHIVTFLKISSLTDATLMSTLIKERIYKCDAKYIHIENQNLTKTEFEFLINPERVEELELNNTTIGNDDGTSVPIDEILNMVPKVRSFTALPFTVSDANVFRNITLCNKLVFFKLFTVLVNNATNFGILLDFLKKYAGSCANFEIHFNGHYNGEVFEKFGTFKNNIDEYFNGWLPGDERPTMKHPSLFNL